MDVFASFTWDPDRVFFTIPYIRHPITWYGVLFALGFFIGYFLVRSFFRVHLLEEGHIEEKRVHSEATFLTDRLAFLMIVGTVVGARLGHVFFYGWPYYREHLGEIVKVWEGGLASHGGVIGILIALLIFRLMHRQKYPSLTFLTLLDILVAPAALGGAFIRMGNFMNQEILGTPTSLPWGVIFLHPLDGIPGIPLHPVQLYEALFYLGVFFFLFFLWKKRKRVGDGLLAGTFFTLVFTFRFFIEYLKLPQSELFEESTSLLDMGQILSLPLIVLGIVLLLRYLRTKCPLSPCGKKR